MNIVSEQKWKGKAKIKEKSVKHKENLLNCEIWMKAFFFDFNEFYENYGHKTKVKSIFFQPILGLNWESDQMSVVLRRRNKMMKNRGQYAKWRKLKSCQIVVFIK